MNKAVIVSAKRTPIGSFLGSLATVPVTELGALAIKAAMDEISLDPKEVDEVLMGHVLQAWHGPSACKTSCVECWTSKRNSLYRNQ